MKPTGQRLLSNQRGASAPGWAGRDNEGRSSRPWARLGRLVRTSRSLGICGKNSIRIGREIERRCLPDQPGFGLRAGFHVLLLLLLLFIGARLLDDLAHLARVLAIERLADRPREGSITRVRDNHSHPRHRLQQRPVQAQNQDQQEGGKRSDQVAHDRTAGGPSLISSLPVRLRPAAG